VRVRSGEREILARFAVRLEEIADEIADATVAEVAAFDPMRDATLRAEIRALSRQQLDAFLDATRRGGAPSPGIVAVVRERAALRARQLVPLAALLHSYLIAQRVISAAIVREAGSDSRSRGAALALTTLTFNYNIAVTTAMADAYVETVQGDVAAAESARLTLVDALLTDQVDDRPELTRRAIGLGFDPDHRQVVVIAVTDQQVPAGRWAAEAIARACGRSARTAFVVGRDDGLVALLDADGPHRAQVVLERAAAQVRQTHGAQLRAGVGTPFVGMSGFRVSYHQARRAARHATRQRPVIVGPQDILLFDELTSGGGAADLIPQATREALGDPMLRDTVQAYVDADLSVTTAARAMSLHPNSVRYRLRRVAELTGRDPLKLTDLLELITAARLLGSSD
jgi:hypothetical protein